MAYQALYRKWRPAVFDDVVGQQHITETLRNQVETGRLSHAYLFVGTRGTGKTTCAKILSRAVNCEHPIHGNPCNACASCRGIENGSILEVEEIDAASNNGVDNIRMLREEAVFSPAAVRKRVYIIDEVHMLSTPAFNALLKILEEPPVHLMFILATTELNKVPATILSRCQRFQFKRIMPEDIAERLTYVAGQEQLNLTREGAALLARLADGGMRDALSLLDQCSGGVIDETRILSAIGLTGARDTMQLFAYIRGEKLTEALSMIDGLYRNGKDLNALLDELQSLIRDILLYQLSGKNSSGLVSGMFAMDELAGLSKQLVPAEAMQMLELLQNAMDNRGTAGSVRLHTELTIMKLCCAQVRTDADALAARVAALEQKTANGVMSPLAANRVEEAKTEVTTGKSPKPEPASAFLDDGPPPWDDSDIPPFDDACMPPPPFEKPRGEVQQPPEAEKPTQTGSMPENKASGLATTIKGASSSEWKRVLEVLQRLVDTPTYTMLVDANMYDGRVEENRYVLHCLNGFAKMMAEQPETMAGLRRAVEDVFGRSIPVVLTEEAVSTGGEKAENANTKETDPLEQLKSFGIVEFS